MRTQSSIDLAIAARADAHYGVVDRGELLALGLSADAIGRRVRSGRLRPLHRGVYAVGHRALRPEAFWLAAVRACGDGAVLSHASAAALWQLRPSAAVVIDVSVPRAGGRRRSGVRVHRCGALRLEEVTTCSAIPITTPARTLLDLAAVQPRRVVERATDQAEVLRLFDLDALRTVVEAHRGRPGAPVLASVLDHHAVGSTLTRSELEERFLALCDAHAVPRPQINTVVCGMEVDFHWPRRRLVVELDGYRFHATRAAFERDRRRDAVLAAAGIRVLRFTHRQLTTSPGDVLRALQPRSMSSTR